MPDRSSPAIVEYLLVDPPTWVRLVHRLLVVALPIIVTVYGIWYDALAAGVAPGAGQVGVFLLAGASLWLGRRLPWVTVAAALGCWMLTESCVFVIAVSYLLARWQPRLWWIFLAVFAAVHPLGLVPDPCAYRAGHTALPPETAPLFAVALPALIGIVVATSAQLAALREDGLRQDAAAAEERARALIQADRLRLSQEMHDLLGHRVSRMVLHATAISATTVDERTRGLAGRIADAGASTVEDLQYIVGVLRSTPSSRHQARPGVPNARESIEEARQDGMRVEAYGLDSLDALAPAVGSVADAVVVEALHNAAKYAAGAPVTVFAEAWSDRLLLRVENDGGLLPPMAGIRPGGHGLRGLRERAAEIAAVVSSGSTDEGGYAVTLEVPL